MLTQIDIEDIKSISKDASLVIMEIYNKDFTVDYKDDKSPLTEADIKSNEIICNALKKKYPHIPIMSEENKEVEFNVRKNWECYWCIDPIDGTKEFIKKNGEFTINIALIHKNTPVLGVVYAPVIEKLYWAKKGEGAYLNGEKLPLKVNTTPKEKLSVVASKSHLSIETQAFIDSLDTKHIDQVSMGSSLKLCLVATGEADIYPRLAPTMEWDTAAADAIVRESGKMSYQFLALKGELNSTQEKDQLSGNTDTPVYKEKMGSEEKTPLLYNKRDLLNPWFVVQ